MSDDRAPDKTLPFLLTTRDMIRTVAERWNRSFGKFPDGSRQRDAGARLAALDLETATREDVKEIVENDGWVKLTCDQCGQDADAIVVVGDMPERDGESCTVQQCSSGAYSCTVDLCLSCMYKAARLAFSQMLERDGVTRDLVSRSLSDEIASKARTRGLLLMVPYDDVLKIAQEADRYTARLEMMVLERLSPHVLPAGSAKASASEKALIGADTRTTGQAHSQDRSLYRGYYPFETRLLKPGQLDELSLTFQRPFRFDTLVASDDCAAGIMVKDIFIGTRSVITSGNDMPIEMFYPSHWPLAFSAPEVPLGAPLRVLVRNTADEDRTLRMGVFGWSVCESTPGTIR